MQPFIANKHDINWNNHSVEYDLRKKCSTGDNHRLKWLWVQSIEDRAYSLELSWKFLKIREILDSRIGWCITAYLWEKFSWFSRILLRFFFNFSRFSRKTFLWKSKKYFLKDRQCVAQMSLEHEPGDPQLLWVYT